MDLTNCPIILASTGASLGVFKDFNTSSMNSYNGYQKLFSSNSYFIQKSLGMFQEFVRDSFDFRLWGFHNSFWFCVICCDVYHAAFLHQFLHNSPNIAAVIDPYWKSSYSSEQKNRHADQICSKQKSSIFLKTNSSECIFDLIEYSLSQLRMVTWVMFSYEFHIEYIQHSGHPKQLCSLIKVLKNLLDIHISMEKNVREYLNWNSCNEENNMASGRISFRILSF